MELTAEAIVFFIFSLMTLGTALLVVTSHNLFHGALYLMICLFGVAGLFVLLTAPLLAGFQVVVYIGAIAILIVFAIMLTPQVTEMRNVVNAQWIGAVVVAALFFVLTVAVVTPLMDELGADDFNADFTEEDPAGVPADTNTTFGEKLVDPDAFMLPFELASVLLMAAMIGAVLLVSPALADETLPPADLAESAGDD